jgi:hypothetical protein
MFPASESVTSGESIRKEAPATCCTVAHPLPTALAGHLNQSRVFAGPLGRDVLLWAQRRAGVRPVLKQVSIGEVNIGRSETSLDKSG